MTFQKGNTIWKGRKHSEKTKKKISKAHKGKTLSTEHREKLRQAKLKNPTKYWLGKKRPEIKKWLTPFEKGHETWNKGKPCPKETKEKIRKANMGKHYSAETEFKKGENTGKNALSWKGGIIHKEGYILIFKPNHPRSVGNYIRRARYVMEKKVGRPLTRKEVVHHINQTTDDDRPENLMLFSNITAHQALHRLLVKSSTASFTVQ